MKNIIRFNDHKILKYQALERGLDYREYRGLLRLHEIPLGTAIENAKRGIFLEDYLKQREEGKINEERKFKRIQKGLKFYFLGAILLSTLSLGYSTITSKPNIDCSYEPKQGAVNDNKIEERIKEYIEKCDTIYGT